MTTQPISGLFDDFTTLDITTPRTHFAGVTAGTGTPVLLLHGYPETHAAWHAVAPALAAHHTVVVPDLPGYGNSQTHTHPNHEWSKRDAATEALELMRALGHERFAVIGHDRGARVGYRLALDHPAHVSAYAALAAVPSLDIWPAVDREFAKANFHWFLFLQPDELAETLLAANPDLFLNTTLTHMAGSVDTLHPAALADYQSSFRRASVRQAMIADYRAGFGVDTEHDAADRAAGRRISCPVLSIWGRERLVAEGASGGDLTAAEIWRRWAHHVTELVVPSGHLIPEHAAPQVVQAVLSLLNHAQR